MEKNQVLDTIKNLPRGNNFADRIDYTITKSKQTGKPFFVILVQLENLENFSRKNPRYVVLNLMREIFNNIRKVVHPRQFVGNFQNGFGLVFDSVDSSKVDNISRKLHYLVKETIQNGKYNDLTSRWTDIISHFLTPGRPTVIYPRLGWGIYPRDGQNSNQVIRRALYHLKEGNI